MTADTYTVVLVPSTNHAIRLEQLLNRENIPCKLIPVPREIRSDCGVCIRVSQQDTARVRDIAKSTNVRVEGFIKL